MALICLILFYLIALTFDFNEILARTPEDGAIKLDETEVDAIGKQVKEKLDMQDTLNLTLRQKLLEA